MKEPVGLSDKELVAEFLKGKVKAFDQLYEKYSDRLYSFSLMVLKNKDDAHDVVQETFLKMWLKRNDLAVEKSFKSFIFTVSYNIMVDTLRKRLSDKNYIEFLEKNFKFDLSVTENNADFNLLNGQISHLIKELPEKRREIFRLSRENGMTYKEIAENLNISVKTVETQINLAIKFLRTRLSDGDLAIILILALFY